MDFIERYFHISPDGGSGATEVTYLAAVLLFAAALVFRRRLLRLLRRGPRVL